MHLGRKHHFEDKIDYSRTEIKANCIQDTEIEYKIKCQFVKNNEGKNRPVSIEFVGFKFRIEILQTAKLFKGTKIFLSNEYTPEE